MKFTKEQWEEIGPIYFGDLPFVGDADQDYMLDVFNVLPNHIQAVAVAHGASDTEFREKMFEFFVRTQFGMSTKQFYDELVFDRPFTNFKFSVYMKDDKL